MAETIPDTDLFLVVDVQNDFCPGGRLAVPAGDEVVPVINRLAERFRHVVLTQDWHPRDHLSFASMHPGTKPYDTVEVAYGTQILWPDHCVQGTVGAEFRRDLHVTHAELILRKGYHRDINSYSAFYENDRKTHTGLASYLRERGFTRMDRRPRVRLLRALFRRRRQARGFRCRGDRGCLPRHRRRRLDGGDAPAAVGAGYRLCSRRGRCLTPARAGLPPDAAISLQQA